MNKPCYILVFLTISLTLVLAEGFQSVNILENGSFEEPAVPVGSGNLPQPQVEGWDISGVYWAIFTADGGVNPIADGLNQLYLYSASATQQRGLLSDYCEYNFSVKVAANSDLTTMQSSYAVMQAVSPDGSRVYELAKIFFGEVVETYLWYSFDLQYINLPTSNLAGHTLQVKIYSAGMLNVDDAGLQITSYAQASIDDFESYGNPLELNEKWIASSQAISATLQNEFHNRYIGGQSMQLNYSMYSASSAEIVYNMSNCIYGNNLQQFSDVELSFYYWGNRVNSDDVRLFLKFYDISDEEYVFYSQSNLSYEAKNLFLVDINRLTARGFDTQNVKEIAIGLENLSMENQNGVIYIDNIQLSSQSKFPYNADINGDGVVDIEDMLIIADNWLLAY